MTRDGLPSHALITGASSGIGGAIAVLLAASGCRVGLAGRDKAKLEAVASRCKGEVDIHVCDVTRADATRDWILGSDDKIPVDCVVACAGIGGGDVLAGPAGESPETARRVIEVNVMGAINAVAPLLERMVARRGGQIVFVSSVAGLIALPDSPAYCASKAALVAYGESLRRLLKPYGVHVSVACPGFVDTEMVRSLPLRPPFMWSADSAALAIVEAAKRRRAVFVFPWQMRLGVFLSRVLPRSLVDIILNRLRPGALSK